MQICNDEFNADVFERRFLVCLNFNVVLAVLNMLAMVMSIARMKNRFTDFSLKEMHTTKFLYVVFLCMVFVIVSLCNLMLHVSAACQCCNIDMKY